jgi:putative oxidoreductase
MHLHLQSGGAVMNGRDLVPVGVALLRVSLGVMFLAHSIVLKWLTYGLAGTAAFFVGVGLPAWLAYATFAGEAVGGLLLVLGIAVRPVALILTLPLLGAVIWVHGANGWVFTAANGGWEYPVYLVILCLAQFLLGAGAFALSRSSVAENAAKELSHA